VRIYPHQSHAQIIAKVVFISVRTCTPLYLRKTPQVLVKTVQVKVITEMKGPFLNLFFLKKKTAKRIGDVRRQLTGAAAKCFSSTTHRIENQ
jgi:hypothetical protein